MNKFRLRILAYEYDISLRGLFVSQASCSDTLPSSPVKSRLPSSYCISHWKSHTGLWWVALFFFQHTLNLQISMLFLSKSLSLRTSH